MPNKNLIDLTGQRFGRLEVLKYNGNSRWECKCDCGKNVSPSVISNVVHGNTYAYVK